ncbi:hypothetical protein BCR39DRAFT_524853 [Naematelia encephala]|uniref:1-phosphatidylinositol 4-kinase n=1 Tax=Naematelia encephala TaxID=71784 RepID=A0A1Y2BBW6_9TREE|nr:hypothetical protein BCR39DRAFT_524853 [Naematelia encephala]
MSHALLLRLFLSPYFSISVAMHYLKIYPDSIGISHYLCWRMKSMPAEEVEFYWPQICHLLLTYPTKSNALESFILERAEESTHSAMLTFWFMQAALRDLTPSRTTNPRPFLICQRVLHRCHEIIFGDPPEPSRSPYRSLPHSPPASTAGGIGSSTASRLLRSPAQETGQKPVTRVNAHLAPALVGMGVMLAGAPGTSGLTELAGQWAIAQGRMPMDDEGDKRSRIEVDKSGGADPVGGGLEARKQSQDSNESEEERPQPLPQPQPTKQLPPIMPRRKTSQPSTAPPAATAFSAHPASTAPNLYSPPVMSTPQLSAIPQVTPPLKGEDPFSQSPTPPPHFTHTSTPSKGGLHQPFYSVPEFSAYTTRQSSAMRRLHPTDGPPPAEALLATYSIDAQRQLLRSHYCRSQIRFLLVLEDVSNRLLVVPKPARVSALRAELTSLNHNLPAEVCMPLWCAADHSHEEGGQTSSSAPLSLRRDRSKTSRTKGHSRVVRISPGDSVVLNSAERAPYLLHVEILEGDLDFDPTRRENRELLKKIVVQEDAKRRKKENGQTTPFIRGSEGFGSPMPDIVPAMPNPDEVPEPEVKSKVVGEDEEMDLVEQLYGAQLSVKDEVPDLSESIPLPTVKNKQLDVETWDRAEGLSRRPSFAPDSPHPGAHETSSPSLNGHHSDNPQVSSTPSTPGGRPTSPPPPAKRTISLEDYSERMRTAAVMLAQLNASLIPNLPEGMQPGKLSWIPGTGWIMGKDSPQSSHGIPEQQPASGTGGKLKLAAAQAAAIRDRIMEEMMALEEERVARMTDMPEGVEVKQEGSGNTAEDEGIVRRELNKADPSAAVFKESWQAKKTRIRASSPWGHLANWDVISVIVKTGTDLRQEQLATQLIERFSRIFKEEKSECWVRFFRILITGEQSGLVETITDAVSVHSIKKGEYARRIAEGGPIGQVSLMDHFVNTYGRPDSGQFARARRNFIKSLAGYSIVTYLLQIKDRHNGNILVDRDGHLIHIDFGFMLSNSPGGNMGFEAAPFKMPLDYLEILGGLDSPGYAYFKKLFKEGFEAARKHSDSLITIVELMQKSWFITIYWTNLLMLLDSKLDCFILFGEQTAHHLRERFALGLTTAAVDAYLERLIVSSTGSNYTRLYDTFQYYSQGVL